MIIAFYVTVALAIILMIIGLIMVLRLKRIARGGTIGKPVSALLALIVLFTIGYLTALLMPFLPNEVSLLVVSAIFFFGAWYVILVLWLIINLIKQVKQSLEL